MYKLRKMQLVRKEAAMDRWQWTVMMLPGMAAGTGAYFLMKYRMESRWKILAKCMVTWMAVCTAAAGVLQRGENPFLSLIFWAMVLFMTADGLLEVYFPAGAAVFGLGHVFLILWYFEKGGFRFETAEIFAVLFLGVSALFRKEKRDLLDRKKYLQVIGLYLYLVFLMAMVSMAVLLPVPLGKEGILPAAGASAFAVSDMMVGKNALTGLPRRVNDFALILYYAAVTCIALVTWGPL